MVDIRDMSALEVSPFHGIALYKSTFTYLLRAEPGSHTLISMLVIV